MRVGILAVQGAFIEHENMLKQLGVDSFLIRQKKDLEQGFDGLVLPGGESTTMGKLLKELELFESLKQKIQEGLPVLATCAGLILLAEEIEGQENTHFKTLPVCVKRNAYGRQLASRVLTGEASFGEIPLILIRGPRIIKKSSEVEMLVSYEGEDMAVRYGNQVAMTFHPELGTDQRIHEYFVDIIKENQENK